MPNFLAGFLSSDEFMPHGHCYLWRPEVVWLHVVSDALIGLAYLSIPITLIYFIRKRRDIPFNWMFVAFGVFILACGATHFMEIWTVWHAAYWLSGVVKVITALASVPTAILLVRLVPLALAIPSQEQLASANRELEREVAERRRAEEALRQSEEQTRLIIETSHDAFIAMDVQGRIAGWNAQAEALFGWTRQEAVGRPLAETVIPPQRREAHHRGLERFLATGEGPVLNRRIEIMALHRNGHEFPVELTISPLRLGETYVFNAFVHDISERKQAEKALARQAAELSEANKMLEEKTRLLTAFHQAGQLILSPLDPEQILDNLAKQIVEAGIFRSLMVALVDEGAKRVEISRGLWRDPDGHIFWNPHQMVGVSYSLEDDNITAEVARAGELQVVEEWDKRFDRRFSRPEDRHGKVAYFIPVKQGGRVLAVLATGSQIEAKEEMLRRIEVMRPLLDQIAIALEHARLYTEARNRSQELSEINRALATENTERKRAEEALRRAHDELAETNAELESFTYTVSHDLRAPLRAMQGFADALREDYADRLDPTGQDYAWRIVAAARRMDTLIQDLLAYSRLSRADLQLHPISLMRMAKDLLAQMEAEFRERNAQVTVRGPLPEVVGHRATLAQVLTNLLTNAVKFVNPDTPPRVRIWAEERDGWVRLCVEDNGIGIAPEHRERIFRVFERLHGVETYPGTGIGLAIVRKGMERMGGRVGVESEVRRGSRFWVELLKSEDKP